MLNCIGKRYEKNVGAILTFQIQQNQVKQRNCHKHANTHKKNSLKQKHDIQSKYRDFLIMLFSNHFDISIKKGNIT